MSAVQVVICKYQFVWDFAVKSAELRHHFEGHVACRPWTKLGPWGQASL